MSDGRRNTQGMEPDAPEKRRHGTRLDDSADPEAADLAHWEGELIRARGEAVIDGRSDWAAQRYATILQSSQLDDTLRSRALNGIAELAETREGRAARRILTEHYRKLGDPASADQLHSLALRLGSEGERVQVLRDRILQAFATHPAPEELIEEVSAHVDTRRIESKEWAHALTAAWSECLHSPNALPLLVLATTYYERAEADAAALNCRLLYLEHTDDIDSDTARKYLNRSLGALSPQTPRAVLEFAHRNRKFIELRARAALLLDSIETTEPSQAFELQRNSSSARTPTRPSRSSQIAQLVHDIELGDSRDPNFREARRAESSLETEITNKEQKPTAAIPRDLIHLELAAHQAPEETAPLYALAAAYGSLNRPHDELNVLGRLSALVQTQHQPHELADLYRRSSELLLELGDRSDALRIRLEAVFLSIMQSEDLHFVLTHCTNELYEDTLTVLRRLIAHASEESEVHLACLGTDLIQNFGGSPSASWDILFPSWQRYPNYLPAAERISDLALKHGKLEALRSAVVALLSEGNFRDAGVIQHFRTVATRLGDDECLILLEINATAAAPLDLNVRRQLEDILLAKGRSRASGFRQVLSLLHDVTARRVWTDLCASALEAERRFSEASSLLLELFLLEPSNDDPFDRALLNLEREHQWPRIFHIVEEDLTRPRSSQSTVTRLRYLSRVERMSGAPSTVALHAAIRVALLYPTESQFDSHARSELAAHADSQLLATYIEKRARRLGATPEAAQLYLEAADVLAAIPNTAPETLQRLLLTARRAGVRLSELDARNKRFERALRAPSQNHEAKDSAPTSERQAEANEFWRLLVNSPAALRAERIAGFLEPTVLKGLHQRARENENALMQTTSTELQLWLFGGADDGHEFNAAQRLNAWTVDSLDPPIQSYLTRIGATGALRTELRTALGDPLDALRTHSRAVVARSSESTVTDGDQMMVGFNSIYWLIKYTSRRLPTMYELLDENSSTWTSRQKVQNDEDAAGDDPVDDIKDLLSVIPWVLGIYGSGSLLSSYRALMYHLGLARAQTLPELIEQLTQTPQVALLFAEWLYLTQLLPPARA